MVIIMNCYKMQINFGNNINMILRKLLSIQKKSYLDQMRKTWISAGLFGDGAASLVLVPPPTYHSSMKMLGKFSPGPQIISHASITVPNTSEVVQVLRSYSGMNVKLDPALPSIVKKYGRVLFNKICNSHSNNLKIKPKDINKWILHP